MKRCQFLILAYFIIGALSLQAQPSASDIILLQEDWDTTSPNTSPTGWSGDIDDNGTLLLEGWIVTDGMTPAANTGTNTTDSGPNLIYFSSGSPALPGDMAETH